MNGLKTFVFISILFLASAIFVFAQNDNKPKIPEGMEAVKIGGSGQIIVPKGAKTRKVGAQIIVEGTKEYMSRRFAEMDERFAKIEAAQAELKKQVEALQTKAGSPAQMPATPPAQTIEKSGSTLIK